MFLVMKRKKERKDQNDNISITHKKQIEQFCWFGEKMKTKKRTSRKKQMGAKKGNFYVEIQQKKENIISVTCWWVFFSFFVFSFCFYIYPVL